MLNFDDLAHQHKLVHIPYMAAGGWVDGVTLTRSFSYY